MNLTEWEIWHSYSTYIKSPLQDLSEIGRQLVESELVECAILKDGQFYWKSDGKLCSGDATIDISQDRTKARITLEPETPTDFAKEAIHQASYFRYKEILLYGEDAGLPPDYISLYLGVARLFRGKETLDIYPIVRLYETGVILVELRMMSPLASVSVTDFIDNYVHIFKWPFDKIAVSPSLVKFANLSFYYSSSSGKLRSRYALYKIDKAFDKFISKRTTIETSGDFQFKLTTLKWLPLEAADASNANTTDEFNCEFEFYDLPRSILAAITFVISEPRLGLRLILQGPNKPYELGNYWCSRPHIYVISHDGQQESAKLNEEQHGHLYGWILAGYTGEDSKDGKQHLPKNLRVLSDHAAYIASHSTLWVMSLKGIREGEEVADNNRGHLIYEHQSKAELLDYGYMLHKRFADSVANIESIDRVLEARTDLIELETQMRESSRFGEIRELLEYGWNAMHIPQLRKTIEDNLLVRQNQTTINEQRRANSLRLIISVVFGFFAIPTLSHEIIMPLWQLLAIPYVHSQLYYHLTSFLLVSIILLLIFRSRWGQGR